MSHYAATVRVEVDVEDCGTVLLFDGDTVEESDVEQSIVLVKARGAMVELAIIEQGGDDIPITVTVADHDPGPDLDGYEEIVEIDFMAPTGELSLIGWCMDWDDAAVRRLPPLPA